jgi:hypothetical protein
MTPSRDPETLLRELGEERVPLEPAEVVAARRERMVEALGRGIRDVPRLREARARRSRWFLAAAAAVVLGLGFSATALLREQAPVASVQASIAGVEAVSGTLVLSHNGRARVVLPGEEPELSAGDALSTAADGSAKLRTGRSVVEVSPATQLKMTSASKAEERMQLSSGRIDLRVERGTDPSRIVVVETPDSEVVVHGTIFSVAVDGKSGVSVTRVRVEEGAVSVLHHGERALLTSGQVWSSAVKAKPLPQQAQPQTAPAPPSAAEPVSTVEPRRVSRVRPERQAVRKNPVESGGPSTLREENRMFQLALEARNRGDDRAAVDLFAALLSKFPSAKLAEEARIERMRALSRLGDASKAAAEARRYLARHATGFAREEARSTALGDSSRSPEK